jgi:hypothetical protein
VDYHFYNFFVAGNIRYETLKAGINPATTITSNCIDFKNQYSIIPPFHYSIFGANPEVPKNLYILNRLWKFRNV